MDDDGGALPVSVTERLGKNGGGERAILFNVIWWYARHDRRLLVTTIDSAGVRAIAQALSARLAWIATGTLLGALFPRLGVAIIAAFIP